MIKKDVFIMFLVLASCARTELEESSLIEDSELTKLSINTGACVFGFGQDMENNPKGGGVGYSSIVSEQNASDTVSNLNSLKTAVQNAQNNDTIFVSGTIDFPAGEVLIIDKSITIAGSRGSSGSCGAVIKANVFGEYNTTSKEWSVNKPSSYSYPIIEIKADNVRITGLQFEGPFGGEGTLPIAKLKKGILIEGASDVLIDNCEFKNWPYYAVGLDTIANNNIVIKNNYFHHNKQKGYGYGIAVSSNAFAFVKSNLFEKNRHDISCSGARGSGFEFAYNVLGKSTHANVDTHGGRDFGWTGADKDIAGSFFYVHHNEFRDDSGSAIQIRGIPEKMFMIEKNKFTDDHAANAIYHFLQKDGTTYNYDEHVFAFNNSYNHNWGDYKNGDYQGYFVSRNYQKNQKIVNLGQNPTLINSTSGNSFQVMDFAIGDFNNDGLNQIFITENQKWSVIDYPEPGTQYLSINRVSYRWQELAGSSIPPSNLRIGDFNGDHVSDVFKANGTNWAISYGGNESWQVVNTSDLGLMELKFGHFNGEDSNGDNTMDVFWANGTDWFLSDGADSGWLDINTSGFDYSDAGTGDFNEDGKMDIFTASNGQFKYVNGGIGGWITFAGSSVGFENLFLYDINNDGKTDALRKYADKYKVIINGESSWKFLETKEFPTLLEVW